MSKTVLTSELKTGTPLIDEQNKVLINSINEYADTIIDNPESEVIGAKLEELLNYIKFHFYTEEQHMLQHKYPDIKAHEQSHDIIIRRLITFNTMYKMGIKHMDRIIASFLSNWIKSHITQSDMHFSAYLEMKQKRKTLPLKTNPNIIHMTPVFSNNRAVTKDA